MTEFVKMKVEAKAIQMENDLWASLRLVFGPDDKLVDALFKTAEDARESAEEFMENITEEFVTRMIRKGEKNKNIVV